MKPKANRQPTSNRRPSPSSDLPASLDVLDQYSRGQNSVGVPTTAVQIANQPSGHSRPSRLAASRRDTDGVRPCANQSPQLSASAPGESIATPTLATLPAPHPAALQFLQEREVAYCASDKSFFVLDTTARRWDAHDANLLQRKLRQWYRATFGQTVPAATLKQMTTEIQIDAPIWKPQHHSGKLVVSNGVLDFTGDHPRLLAHDPNLQFEHRLDVAYDPNAPAPKFARFVQRAVGEEDARLIQKWLGAVLAGANDSQVVLALIGNPGTGKGTLVELVTKLIGVGQTAELRVEQLTERFEMSAYRGRRLLIGVEIPADLLSTKGIGRLKALVGHDRMEAELKIWNRRVPIRGDFHALLTGNSLDPQPWSPAVDAFRRRLLIVAFNQGLPAKVMLNLATELWHEEAAGILAWAVEGVRLYRAAIAEHGTLTLTTEQQARLNDIIPPPPAHTRNQSAKTGPTEAQQRNFESRTLWGWLVGLWQRLELRLKSTAGTKVK